MSSLRQFSIAWNSMPTYAAFLIQALRQRLAGNLDIIATELDVPSTGAEEIVGDRIHWLANGDRAPKWRDLGLSVPDVFFQAGWAYDSFNQLGKEVKAAGGRVILLMDNCWKGNLRQVLGAVYFRIMLRRHYDGVIVPGESGRRLARFLGFSNAQIRKNLYGVNSEIFDQGCPLSQRPKRIAFVGQMIERKGVREISSAFSEFNERHPDWDLEVCGNGELSDIFLNKSGVIPHSFLPSEEVASLLRNSRVLVLPSLEDHWPLVVHEAVSSGCALILSSKVGNRFELLNESNGRVVRAGSVSSLVEAFEGLSVMTSEEWDLAYSTSLKLASEYGPRQFAESAIDLVEALSK